ncbi:maleylacetoacetate isomerase [Tropicimonas sediminicola]|uniref:Maleylacetoacetate isomerase n=1 Tax=Tropicimonas sediminicola TaxID=1031541 RepID=A0A239FQN6_9RHOB|nr:maleylacetoacetate isomerase [Tropicimonas sediminicola]SNS59376.1 maleylacetoacetate isomerase [Tropicimonas sediminicola]
MRLYTYWRSTTSYRVRIALNLKGLAFEPVPVNLVAGEQCSPEYTALNPGQGVPTLVLDDGSVLTQSLAILDYLDAVAPEPPLLPGDPIARAHVQAAVQTIAVDIHPVNNLKVLGRLKAEHGLSAEDGVDWMRHWMERGLQAYQALLPEGPAFSFGDQPGLADICLVPQLYNAHRWGVDLTRFPRLLDIEQRALQLPAFEAARPENQPDAA